MAQHTIDYCDHRGACKNKGCKMLAMETSPASDDVAYCDVIHCKKYKGPEGRPEDWQGQEVTLTGVWTGAKIVSRFRL